MDTSIIKDLASLTSAVAALVGAVGGFLTGRVWGKKEQHHQDTNSPKEFYYAQGTFRKESGGWEEYDSHGSYKFSFKPLRMEDGYIVIYDHTRQLRVRLPIKGGQAQYAGIEDPAWRNLYRVEPVNDYA